MIVNVGMGQDEEVLLQVRKHWFYVGLPLLVTLFFALIFIATRSGGLIIPFLIFDAYRILQYFLHVMYVTNKKLHVSVGLITKQVVSVPLQKINNIAYTQGIFGRIMGYGDIQISSAALDGVTSYEFIEKPLMVKTAIEEAIAKNESRN